MAFHARQKSLKKIMRFFILFFINCFFIAISTFIVTKALNIPHKKSVDYEKQHRVRKFIFISSIHVLLYPYSKLTISRYIKENTKLKKEPWYLCKLSALFYLLMAIPVGLPSFIYYTLKRN